MKSIFFKASWKLATLALAAGALPVIVSPASAIEHGKGQYLDKGKYPRHYTVGSTGQKIACPGPKCTQEFINDAVQRGVMTPKEATTIRTLQQRQQTN